MRLTALAAGLILVALAALASEERPLTGPEIAEILTGAEVIGEGTRQVFYKSGRTLYEDGRPSWGYWRVQGENIARNGRPARAGPAMTCDLGRRGAGSGSSGSAPMARGMMGMSRARIVRGCAIA